MALSKVTYVDGVTVIRAQNLNDIQDEILANTGSISTIADNFVLEYDPTSHYVVNDTCLYDGGLYVCIENTPSPAGEFSSGYWDSNNIGDILGDTGQKVESAIYALAEEYARQPYTKGEYCRVYDDDGGVTIYRCKDDIETAEAWTASHWERVNIGDELTNHTNKLDEMEGALSIATEEQIDELFE